jgi:hypothetical protein
MGDLPRGSQAGDTYFLHPACALDWSQARQGHMRYRGRGKEWTGQGSDDQDHGGPRR